MKVCPRIIDVVDRGDVRVIDRRGQRRFLDEALTSILVARESGGNQFERDAS